MDGNTLAKTCERACGMLESERSRVACEWSMLTARLAQQLQVLERHHEQKQDLCYWASDPYPELCDLGLHLCAGRTCQCLAGPLFPSPRSASARHSARPAAHCHLQSDSHNHSDYGDLHHTQSVSFQRPLHVPPTPIWHARPFRHQRSFRLPPGNPDPYSLANADGYVSACH